jgi:hypothetical protein
MPEVDVIAAAMSAAWDRLNLQDKQAAMAEQESAAFQTLALQLGISPAELRHRANVRRSRAA